MELKDMEHKNIALEVLKKLLNDEIKVRMNRNIVQGRSLMEMLEDSIRRYHNKVITAVEVIDELIGLSKHIVAQDEASKELGLSEYEYAFYSAVADNESAMELMGKDKLRKFKENENFRCLVQPATSEVLNCDHPLKGRWGSDFFGNDNPIIVELCCGKGDYTVDLAERNPSFLSANDITAPNMRPRWDQPFRYPRKDNPCGALPQRSRRGYGRCWRKRDRSGRYPPSKTREPLTDTAAETTLSRSPGRRVCM